jgi:transposase-like protein
MARYGQKFKANAVARLLPPQSCPVETLSARIGISVGTLERWRAEALANASGNSGGGAATRWTAVARLETVIATAAMDAATRAGWCREQGLYPLDLETWKQDAISGLGEPHDAETAEMKRDRRRIKELERDLNRKDKALAETAALLVLSKKLSAIFHEGADA